MYESPIVVTQPKDSAFVYTLGDWSWTGYPCVGMTSGWPSNNPIAKRSWMFRPDSTWAQVETYVSSGSQRPALYNVRIK